MMMMGVTLQGRRWANTAPAALPCQLPAVRPERRFPRRCDGTDPAMPPQSSCGVLASCTSTSSHSPSTTASTASFRSAARGVVEPWGPTATRSAGRPASARRSRLRDAQLGRSAAPEQIARGSGDDNHVRREIHNPRPQRGIVEVFRLGIDNSSRMPGIRQQCRGIAEFQRQVRLAAAEINAAGEIPVGVYQRHPHWIATRNVGRSPMKRHDHTVRPREASALSASPTRSTATRPSSQPTSLPMPSSRLVCGR